MALYITVDGGTTNTRIYLVRDGEVTDTRKLPAGARDGKENLMAALARGIADILAGNGLSHTDVTRILASGMITSEYGLCDLAHVTLPAGKRALHHAMHETVIGEISPVPFCFIRGVKMSGDSLEDLDMMRGEETELMGILTDTAEDVLYVLPGSHSKHVSVDREGRITRLKTMLSGELFAAVIEHTILKDAADFAHNRIVEGDLLRGYHYCKSHGINEALFKTRILRNMCGAEKESCYSFLLGAVLSDEVGAILQSTEGTVVIGGQKQFKTALAILLQSEGSKRVIVLSEREVEHSTALGAVRVYECE